MPRLHLRLAPRIAVAGTCVEATVVLSGGEDANAHLSVLGTDASGPNVLHRRGLGRSRLCPGWTGRGWVRLRAGAPGVARDPEVLHHLEERYLEEVRKGVERHGGTIQTSAATSVVAAFGIPVLHEDDALRAVRASVAVREALDGLNVELERDWGDAAGRSRWHRGSAA